MHRRAVFIACGVAMVAGGAALWGAGHLWRHAAGSPASGRQGGETVGAAGPSGAPLPARQYPTAGVPARFDDHDEPDDHDDSFRMNLAGRPVPELVGIARSAGDPWIKTDVIEELASRQAREGVPEIAALLRDRDRDVRRVAADALAELGADDQLPAIRVAFARENDRDVRQIMEQAIRELNHD